MSSSNGHAHVAAEMREPVRPLRAAEMSSQQRNALVDELVAVVNNHGRVLRELRAKAEQQQAEIASLKLQQGATFNSLAEFCGRPFLARLRWIVTGR